MEKNEELSDGLYLRDLAERLMNVPIMYGVDQGDCDRLVAIADFVGDE